MKYSLSLTGTFFFIAMSIARVLSYTGTCTMGSTDSFASGLILFVFFDLISNGFFYLAGPSAYFHRWAVSFTAMLIFISTAHPGIHSTFWGTHLCNALDGGPWETLPGEVIHSLYYPPLWILTLTGVALSTNPAQRPIDR